MLFRVHTTRQRLRAAAWFGAWVILLVLAGNSGFARANDSPPPSPTTLRIVAFGDSLTAGLGVSTDDTYPAQLERRLSALGLPHRVVNAGVSGETTAGGLRRVPWLLKSRPDLVILELGANDGLRGLRVEDTRSNLEQIIKQIQEAGTPVILAGMKLPPNYGQAYTTGFERIYPELAKQYHLTLVPFFLDGVAGSARLNQTDGIHPTAEGYRLVVENLLPTLLPLLRGEHSGTSGGKRKTPTELNHQPGRSP